MTKNTYELNVSAFNLAIIIYLIFAVLFLVNCAAPKQDATAIFDEGFVKSNDNVELYYQIRGKGKDTLIMLHGGPGMNFDYMAPDLEQLEESFIVIYYDQRGNGRSTLVSDPELINIAAHVADLESVRKYFGLEKFSILGHSWGALLASFYALEHAEKLDKIVFVAPASARRAPYFQQLTPNIISWMDSTYLADFEQLRLGRRDSKESCEAFWELFIRGYFADPFDIETISSMRGSFCSVTIEALQNGAVVGRYTMESAGDFDMRDKLQHVEAPVLIITGIRDIFPVEAMHEWETTFPNAQLVLLDGAGHYPQIERPEEFFNIVKSFLKE